jgi:hypothetical protein
MERSFIMVEDVEFLGTQHSALLVQYRLLSAEEREPQPGSSVIIVTVGDFCRNKDLFRP